VLFRSLLKDKNVRVRANALRALSKLSGSKALPSLIKALSSDTNERVRATAANMLGGLGNKRAKPALTKALNDKSLRVQNEAKAALEKIEKAKEQK